MEKMPLLKNTVYEDVARNAHGFYSLPIQLAMCIPSVCSPHEVAGIIRKLLSPLFMSIELGPTCDIDSSDSLSFFQSLNSHQIFAVIAISFFVSLVLISTFTHLYIREERSIASVPRNAIESKNCFSLLLTFSAIQSSKKLFSTEQEADTKLHFIHGMRVMTMVWIVICHTYTYGTQFLTEIGCGYFFVVKLLFFHAKRINMFFVCRRSNSGRHSPKEVRLLDAAGPEWLALRRNILLSEVSILLFREV